MNSYYSNLYYLNQESKVIAFKELDELKIFLENLDLSYKSSEDNLETELYNLCIRDYLDSKPLICLRCKVSKAISDFIKITYKKYKDKLHLYEIAEILLIDDGKEYIKVRDEFGNISRKKINISFLNENLDLPLPISFEILRTYNSKKSSLSTWSFHMIKSNKEFKVLLRNNRIKTQISKWARIYDKSSKRIKEALVSFGINKKEIEEIISLLYYYKIEYKAAKKIHYEEKGSLSGWTPDLKFLNSLQPPQKDDKIFNLIEEALDFYENPEFIEKKDNKKDILENIPYKEKDINYSDEKIKVIRNIIEKSVYEVVNNVLVEEKKIWINNQEREKCWVLYSKGLSQRDIAKKCGHKQGWVSKLLRESILAELIINKTLITLKDEDSFHKISCDPVNLDALKLEIRNQILLPDQLNNCSKIRKWVGALLKK